MYFTGSRPLKYQIWFFESFLESGAIGYLKKLIFQCLVPVCISAWKVTQMSWGGGEVTWNSPFFFYLPKIRNRLTIYSLTFTKISCTTRDIVIIFFRRVFQIIFMEEKRRNDYLTINLVKYIINKNLFIGLCCKYIYIYSDMSRHDVLKKAKFNEEMLRS